MIMATALAKTMTDEERKKAEAARRVKPVSGVRSSRNAPKQKTAAEKASWAKSPRGPKTVAQARAAAQQGGTGRGRSTGSRSRQYPEQGVTNKAEKEPSYIKQLKRFFGLTAPMKR